MEGIWDLRADAVQEGDNLRDVDHNARKTRIDDNGFTRYIFSKKLFKTSTYIIPDDDFKLFKMFLDGEALVYPSDGEIPIDVVAIEARNVLNYIVTCSKNLRSPYNEDANIVLKNGKNSLVRGALKLYLGGYTTRYWRRKRFTSSISFFTFQVSLLDHTLRQMGWVKNKETNKWEKSLQWFDPDTTKKKHDAICTAHNLNQLLDFTSENYFKGTKLREIFIKNLKRGLDVDLNDIINVALYNNSLNKKNKDEMNDVWESFEVTTNTRSARITSNIISLCRYSLGIADHLERVSFVLDKYHDKIFDKKEYPDEALKKISRILTHWKQNFEKNDSEPTRDMTHELLLEQRDEISIYVLNLRTFAKRILELLNSKYNYLKIIFEIE
ncbi:MAG: hypothetical protein ACW990_01910 [Promethearchaeota archaeon]|jgi:hypothetical protein